MYLYRGVRWQWAVAPRKPEQRTSAFDQEQTATAAAECPRTGDAWGWGGGMGAALETQQQHDQPLWPVDALFLSHTESLFAAGGLHSCLWPDTTRFYESRVPPLAGADGHNSPGCRLCTSVRVISQKNSITLPFITFLWNVTSMRLIFHIKPDVTALTNFIQKNYTNPIILISLYQDIILRMVKYYCDQKRDTAVKIQILFTKMVYVVLKKSGTIW